MARSIECVCDCNPSYFKFVKTVCDLKSYKQYSLLDNHTIACVMLMNTLYVWTSILRKVRIYTHTHNYSYDSYYSNKS